MCEEWREEREGMTGNGIGGWDCTPPKNAGTLGPSCSSRCPPSTYERTLTAPTHHYTQLRASLHTSLHTCNTAQPPHLLRRVDDARGNDVAAHDAPKDVHQDRLHLGVAGQDLERRHHLQQKWQGEAQNRSASWLSATHAICIANALTTLSSCKVLPVRNIL